MISCDKVVEEDETFNLTFSLANSNDQIIIGLSTALVQIGDSTGKSHALLILMQLHIMNMFVCMQYTHIGVFNKYMTRV